MGLNITAFSNLKHVGRHTDDGCYDDNHIEAYAYDCFLQSFRGIPVLGIERYDNDTSLLIGGCYETTAETERHNFSAGSYTDYNAWRAALQEQFNPERNPNGPFYELIWFADNAGSIGPYAARDLLVDFEQHAGEYAAQRAGGSLRVDYDVQCYAEWTRAFRLAATGGLVRFH